MHAAALRVTQKRTPQTIRNPICVFTKSDWLAFREQGKSQGQLVSRMIQWIRLSGVHTATEQTVRKLAAILACMMWPTVDPSPTLTHALVK